jgi:hypothetical protein
MRVKVVEISCAHVCKWNNEPVENYPRSGGKGDKEE